MSAMGKPMLRDGVEERGHVRITEAAKILSLSAYQVRRLADEGRLRCTRRENGVRLFLKSDVLARARMYRKVEDEGSLQALVLDLMVAGDTNTEIVRKARVPIDLVKELREQYDQDRLARGELTKAAE